MIHHDYVTHLMFRHEGARLERVNRTHWMYREVAPASPLRRKWASLFRRRPFIRNGVIHPVGADGE